MTLYPRRDVVYVAVEPQQGGCGAAHSRPVTQGVPDQDWSLSCPRCEVTLADNPLWAKTRAEVPETPDEITKRENLAKQKDRNLEEIQTAAMAHMAWGSASPPQIASQPVMCKRGHQNTPLAKFCSECGMLMKDAEIIPMPATPLAVVPEKPDYNRLPVSKLRELAEQHGINPKQTKRQLVEALS
jgi:hypothetical protein